MLTAKLRTKAGGAIAELPLYRSCYEVPLSRAIPFLVEAQPLFDDLPPEGEDSEPRENPILVMARAVAELTDVPLPDILTARLGPLYFEEPTMDGSLRTAFGWYAKLLHSYKPRLRPDADAVFVYRDQEYHIPVILQQALQGLPLLPHVDAVEGIEALEVSRLVAHHTDTSGDPDGSHWYNYYLRILAIFARRAGERLPTQPTEVERFINDRSLLFRDIDMGTAMDVDFFLNGILRQCARTHPVIGFLTLRAFALVVVTQRPSVKRTTRRYATTRRSLKK